MKLFLRAAAVSLFLIALATAGIVAAPDLAQDVRGLWYVMDDRERLQAAEESIARIDRQTEVLQQRIAVKQEAVRDLLAGRLTFADAAERFAAANRVGTPSTEHLRRLYPGQTDDDRAAWQLICFLRRMKEPAATDLADEWECVLSLQG